MRRGSFRREYAAAHAAFARDGSHSAYLEQKIYTFHEKVEMLPRVVPFVVLLIGVMVALYGGYATPSETAGLGAVLALILIAVAYYVWRPKDLAPILGATLKESTMLMFIIGMSLLFSYVMSYLHISQSAAQAIVVMQLVEMAAAGRDPDDGRVLGFFLPPVSIILMTAPIILPPLRTAGFDLIWFGVLMTIVMEMGLIHPPVGLNLFVIKNIAPDIPLRDVVWGVLPFVGLMFVAILLICLAPAIATGFPNWVMGPGSAREPLGYSSQRKSRAAPRRRLPARSPRCRPTPQNDGPGVPAPDRSSMSATISAGSSRVTRAIAAGSIATTRASVSASTRAACKALAKNAAL